MATLAELETALINADKAGDMDAARKLAAAVSASRKDSANLIPGSVIPVTIQQAPEPTFVDQAIGAGETGLALATGATGGAMGMIGGTLKGLAEQILSGKFGTAEAQRAVEQSASSGAQALTYAPRGQVGQERVAQAGALMQNVLPITPLTGELTMAAQGARTAAPAIAAAAQRGTQAAQQVAQRAAAPVQRAAQGVGELVGIGGAESTAGRGSVGAAATPQALQRQVISESMPVPFKGESALTKGMLSRDYEQLKFEKETAKLGEVGAPLRARTENISETVLQNFDALVDKPGPLTLNARDIGRGVDQAIFNKANVAKRKITKAYDEAKTAGELQQPVEMLPLAGRLDDLAKFEGVATNIAPIKREAVRLGAVAVDDTGATIPQKITLENSELLRQFVNEATDWGDKRQALMGRRINESIDLATENAGGKLYREARKLRREYAQEFENVGLTSKLMKTKRGTDERQIALDDVFDRVIVRSSLEEMNKLRKTLISAGPEGKQSWADMKAKTIDSIKEGALSASQRDSRGNPLISVDKLQKSIAMYDRDGKLDSLFGKKQAQTIRDLGELASEIYTAPPGAVNFSNTASAIMVAMDGLLGFTATGIPLPAVTAIKEAAKYVKNRKLKVRINDALNKGQK
jgi:hypothetical protein